MDNPFACFENEIRRVLELPVSVYWATAESTEVVSTRLRAWLGIATREVLEIPPPTRSLAHTQAAKSQVIGVAAQIAAGGELGIGVDIERADREIRSGVQKRVRAEGEGYLGLLSIEEWVIKEASFKASSQSTRGAPVVLTDLRVSTWRPEQTMDGETMDGKTRAFCRGVATVECLKAEGSRGIQVALFEWVHEELDGHSVPLLVAIAISRLK